MGTENLFHKRRARGKSSLEPISQRRSRYDRVLLVCEGEKTEPNYFKGLIKHYQLNTANVEVDDSSGSSPKSVFERAQRRWKREKERKNPYDRIYCIFDKDTHTTYEQTLQKISNKDSFYEATSVPSFEYWLLLHYEFTTKSFTSAGKRSAAKAVEKQLKKYLPNYSKGDKKLFSNLFDKLEKAKQNTELSLKEAENGGGDYPTTKVHELVDYLQKLQPNQQG